MGGLVLIRAIQWEAQRATQSNQGQRKRGVKGSGEQTRGKPLPERFSQYARIRSGRSGVIVSCCQLIPGFFSPMIEGGKELSSAPTRKAAAQSACSSQSSYAAGLGLRRRPATAGEES